jgi:hypothetical protein
LRAGGALIKGIKPEKSPSLKGYPFCDKEVAKLADEIWDNSSVDTASVGEAFKKMKLAPDFFGGVTGRDLQFIHRINGEDEIYFISSPKDESRDEVCEFRVAGKNPELWNPETGEIMNVVVWDKKAENTTQIPIHFSPNGAVFVVFRNGKSLPDQHISNATAMLQKQVMKPLLDLQVTKAEYGDFLPEGLVDVTSALAKKVTADGLRFTADNSLTTTDPAPRLVKELRLQYDLAGKVYEISMPENQQKDIETDNEKFTLLRAVYGQFPNDLTGLPATPVVNDVLMTVKSLLKSKKFSFTVTDSLFDKVVGNANGKQLKLRYIAEGDTHEVVVRNGEVVHLELDTPQPRLVYENGAPTWVSPYPGKIKYVIEGTEKYGEIKEIPKPIELSGPWEISFPENLGAPPKATFEKLGSWSLSSDEGIRYFSGTATYRKEFTLAGEFVSKDNSIELDLGSVRVIAEVIVNGKNLGVLWKSPFRIDLKDAVRAGKNQLELRITNLWPNRLIGDAQYPEDVKGKYGIPDAWPKWLLDPTVKRDSKRITFSTWKHWDETSKLQPSGLLGPVLLRSYRHYRLP